MQFAVRVKHEKTAYVVVSATDAQEAFQKAEELDKSKIDWESDEFSAGWAIPFPKEASNAHSPVRQKGL